MLYRCISLSGLLVMIGLAWLCSTDRRRIPWSLVVKGTVLLFVFAVHVLRTQAGRAFFEAAGTAIKFVLDASKDCTRFVFGALAEEKIFRSAMGDPKWGFIVFVHVTGTIILVSALMSALYYVGIMQWVVWAMAKVMQVVMGTSGSESLAAASNVFVGQTEAPLVIKPYLPRMLAGVGLGRGPGDLLAAAVLRGTVPLSTPFNARCSASMSYPWARPRSIIVRLAAYGGELRQARHRATQ